MSDSRSFEGVTRSYNTPCKPEIIKPLCSSSLVAPKSKNGNTTGINGKTLLENGSTQMSSKEYLNGNERGILSSEGD
jgi:hypothetical protein